MGAEYTEVMGQRTGILPALAARQEAHYRVMELATQQEANLAAAAARQHIEDIELLRVWQDAGVELSYEVGRKLFELEATI